MYGGLMVKRTLLVAVVLASLALAVPAQAGESEWNGEVADGGFMAFNDSRLGNRINKIRDFDWGAGVKIECSKGTFPNSGGIDVGMKLRNKKFRGVEDEGAFTEKVKGKLIGGGEAEGTIRVTGDYDGHTDCDTAKLHWTATKKS